MVHESIQIATVHDLGAVQILLAKILGNRTADCSNGTLLLFNACEYAKKYFTFVYIDTVPGGLFCKKKVLGWELIRGEAYSKMGAYFTKIALGQVRFRRLGGLFEGGGLFQGVGLFKD